MNGSMVTIFIEEEVICCKFYTDAFDSIVAILKEHRCHYKPARKYWEIPIIRYEKVLEALQDVDTIQISEADQRLIPQLSLGKPELRLSKIRLTFHGELLRWPPIQGKPPFEDFQLRDILRSINRNRYGLFLDMGCIEGSAIVSINRQGATKKISLETLYKKFNHLESTDGRYGWDSSKTYIRSLLEGRFGLNEVLAVLYKGRKVVYRLQLQSGKELKLTEDHELLAENNEWKELKYFQIGEKILTNGVPTCSRCDGTERVITNPKAKYAGHCHSCKATLVNLRRLGNHSILGGDGYVYLKGEKYFDNPRYSTEGLLEHIHIMEQYLGRALAPNEQVHHKNRIRNDNRFENLELLSLSDHAEKHEVWNHFNRGFFHHASKKEVVMIPRIDTIVSITSCGVEDVYDVVCGDPHHNFVANGIVVHNCGKAYIAAAIVAHLRYYGLADKVLLISSNIGAANMVHEMKKFIIDLNPDEITCLTKISRVKKKDREIFKPETRMIITNYSTLRHLSDHYHAKEGGKSKAYRKAPIPIEEWLGGKPGILLLDESHALGNPASQQTKRIQMHVPFFEYRYEFTGTPADKPEKLYSQLKVLDEALVHNLSYQDWCVEYNNVGNTWSSYAINPQGWKHDKLQALNARVTKDYAIFRKSIDCIDLPPNIIKKLYTRLDTKHRSIYQAFVTTTLNHIRETTGKLGTRDIMNAFPYMQMALDNPSLLLSHSHVLGNELQETIESFNFEKDSTKVEMLTDILEERIGEQGERGIIWVFHPDTAHKLMKIYEKYNPLYIVGEIADADRMPIIEKFKTQTEHKILIAGIPVLNTSITVTEATFQVYFERVYNFAQYWQSMARIHRIGQTKTTVTYVLIFDESIDISLDINLETKDALNSKILSKEFLSLQEWKKVFNAKDSGDFSLDF